MLKSINLSYDIDSLGEHLYRVPLYQNKTKLRFTSKYFLFLNITFKFIKAKINMEKNATA